MRLLIDSHVVVWWLDNPAKLSPIARAALQDPSNEVFLSAASVWELGLKMAKGKLHMPPGFAEVLAQDGFENLDISVAHASRSMELPPHHADPFDRILIAQALLEGMVLVTRDGYIPSYDVPVMEA
jgi:PIN domain nuclease of toxin-antitoxin system